MKICDVYVCIKSIVHISRMISLAWRKTHIAHCIWSWYEKLQAPRRLCCTLTLYVSVYLCVCFWYFVFGKNSVPNSIQAQLQRQRNIVMRLWENTLRQYNKNNNNEAELCEYHQETERIHHAKWTYIDMPPDSAHEQK